MAGGEVDVGKTEGDAVEELVHNGTFPPGPAHANKGTVTTPRRRSRFSQCTRRYGKNTEISYLLKSRIIKGPTSKRVELIYSILILEY